jgi:hypothetical protein
MCRGFAAAPLAPVMIIVAVCRCRTLCMVTEVYVQVGSIWTLASLSLARLLTPRPFRTFRDEWPYLSRGRSPCGWVPGLAVMES